MSKVRLTGSNSGYVEIAAAADAGNLTFTMPTSGTALLGNNGNVFSGITTTGQLDINGSIDVSSTSVFNDDLTLAGASYNVVWDKSDNQLEFGDNAKLSFGASSDLQLFHDGNHSIIEESGTGGLKLVSNSSFQLRDSDKDTGDYCINANINGDVSLYSNGTKRIETTNTGAVVTGICTATSFSGSGENLTRTTPYSHRNKIINGNFHIWQRATSSSSSGYVAADRWHHNLSGASMTFSRQTHTNPIDGSRYYARIASTSSSDYCGIFQRIEDAASIPEGKATLSFWARGHVNANLAAWITIHYDSSADVDVAQQTTPYLQNDSTFRKYSLTFDIPSHSGKTFGAASYFQIALGQGTNNSASSWTLDISNIQLEVGSVATPFEQRSHGEELARCQRYYQTVGSSILSSGYGSADGYSRGSHIFATEMRATPTVTITETSSGSLLAQGQSPSGFYATFSGLGGSQASLYKFVANAEL
tara:strand:- start:1435 stop:2862 length:1428 start_codon:yes stop_codon:yes gene_type:complete